MRLRVEQVYPGERPIALVVEQQNLPISVKAGDTLRCAGYRYLVHSVRGTTHSVQVGLELESQYAIRPAMVLRPDSEPIADDELASVTARACHILHLLAELDAENAVARFSAEQAKCGAPPDLLLAYFQKAGVDDELYAVLRALHLAKMALPELERQRALQSVVEVVNNQLSVIQMTTESRAAIGS